MTNASVPPRSATRPLAALSLCVLLPSLAISIANVALPALARAFDASIQEVQLVVVVYLLAHTAFIFLAGRLGDAAGRRKVLVAGAWIFAAASVACGFAPALWMLDFARVLQGAGAAAMMALAMALVGDAVPRERTGRAMGLLGTMSAVGTALGPSLGGILTATLGWRAVFIAMVPLALAAAVLARRHLPPDEPRTGVRKAARGRIGADAALAGTLAMSAIVSTVMMATLIVGPFHLSRGLGLDIATVGIVMSAGPLGAALAGLPAGRMVDRYAAARTSLAGLAGMTAGCLGLALAPASWGIVGYLVPLVVLTANYALFQAANNTAALKDAPPDRRGAVAGALSLARNTGLVLGASAMGTVFASWGMQVTFLACAALVAAALAIAMKGAMRAAARLA